jgi:tetraacyldisaccharide 4'-kinase
VTVVSDGERLLADLDRAGDEPLMLARRLPGVPVLVSSDRYLSGRLAERRFGCSVHLLDDGFQHFQLERDVDLVVVSGADLARPATLPSGHLREPLDVVREASAVVLADVEPAEDEAAVRALGALAVKTMFRLVRESGSPQPIDEGDRFEPPAAGTRVLAVAGLARPARFFADVGQHGWTVAGTLAFRDHHRYTRGDIARIAAAMRSAGAAMVVTTEKDLVRMLPLRPLPVPVAWLPLSVSIEPAAEFAAWLADRCSAGL